MKPGAKYADLCWAGLGWAGLRTLETMQPGIRDEMASAEADMETVWTLDLDTGHSPDHQLQGKCCVSLPAASASLCPAHTDNLNDALALTCGGPDGRRLDAGMHRFPLRPQ